MIIGRILQCREWNHGLMIWVRISQYRFCLIESIHAQVNDLSKLISAEGSREIAGEEDLCGRLEFIVAGPEEEADEETVQKLKFVRDVGAVDANGIDRFHDCFKYLQHFSVALHKSPCTSLIECRGIDFPGRELAEGVEITICIEDGGIEEIAENQDPELAGSIQVENVSAIQTADLKRRVADSVHAAEEGDLEFTVYRVEWNTQSSGDLHGIGMAVFFEVELIGHLFQIVRKEVSVRLMLDIFGHRETPLLNKLIDGLIEGFDFAHITCTNRFFHTFLKVILEYDFAGVVEGRLDSGQLDEDLAAVTAVFYHSFHHFKMADGSGQTIYDCPVVLTGSR